MNQSEWDHLNNNDHPFSPAAYLSVAKLVALAICDLFIKGGWPFTQFNGFNGKKRNEDESKAKNDESKAKNGL